MPSDAPTLADRIAAAKAASQAARKQSPKPKAKAQPLAAPKPIAKAPKPQPPAKEGKTAVVRRGNPSSRARLTATIQRADLTEAQREQLAGVLRTISVRPGALHAFEGDVLDSIEAVIAGAKVPGPAGHGDRMTLFKLVGLPLHAGAQNGGGKGEAITAMRNLTSALERAHLRGSGRVPVTVDAELVEEVPQNGAFEGYTQKMGDLVRMPDAQPEPPAQEPIGATGEGDRPSSSTENVEAWSLPDFLRGP